MSDYDWTEEEWTLAVQLHDLECSDHTCEPQVFAHLFPRARRLLASDWLAKHDEATRGDQNKQIAIAIEELRQHFLAGLTPENPASDQHRANSNRAYGAHHALDIANGHVFHFGHTTESAS